MKSIIGCGLSLGLAVSVYAGETVYQYQRDNGSTILTSKRKAKNDINWTYEKQTYYHDSNIARPLTEEDLQKEEIRVYKQEYQEWLKKGGKNSGIKPPVKPVKIVHELTFWPVLYGQLWVGTGLVAADSIEINDGFNTNEDCMSNKAYYISVYGKQLKLDLPKHVKVAKTPKKTYTLDCYSTVGPVERSLVP